MRFWKDAVCHESDSNAMWGLLEKVVTVEGAICKVKAIHCEPLRHGVVKLNFQFQLLKYIDPDYKEEASAEASPINIETLRLQ